MKNNIILKMISMAAVLTLLFSFVSIYAVDNTDDSTDTAAGQESTSDTSDDETSGEESTEDSSNPGTEDPIELTGIVFDRDTLNLTVGEAAKLNVLPAPDNAALPEEPIHFSSDTENVVSVAEDGTVTALAKGTAVITATMLDGLYSCTCTVTVVQAESSIRFTVLENTGEKIVTGFSVGMLISDAVSAVAGAKEISSDAVSITDAEGQSMPDSASVATGCIVTVEGVAYIAVIKGDLNSDGIISSDDVQALVRYLVGTGDLTRAQTLAADIRDNGEMTIENAYLIQRHIYGQYSIKQ